ncbi:MAG TPA: DMT family transporter [Acidimicrobiales bacterium]|nr:DMT family transporter [Acidimicrobiales bacterium]
MSVLFALLGAFSQGLTSVLQRLANVSGSELGRSAWGTTKYLVRQPMWLLGMLTMGGTFVFTALALYFGQLATVQPILVTELIFTLALRALWLRDRIAQRTWGAAALLCAGLGGFLLVADPQEGHGHPGVGKWAVAIGSRGLVVVVLVVLSRWGSPARRAALLGAAAALVWAIDAAFVKAATEVLARHGWSGLFVHWPVYGVVVTGVLGTVLLEAAFTAGPLAASQSALLIVDPLASIAIGIELFGEQLRDSPVAILLQAVLLCAMFTGVVLLSKWAPPEMVARIKRPRRADTAGGASADLDRDSIRPDPALG